MRGKSSMNDGSNIESNPSFFSKHKNAIIGCSVATGGALAIGGGIAAGFAINKQQKRKKLAQQQQQSDNNDQPRIIGEAEKQFSTMEFQRTLDLIKIQLGVIKSKHDQNDQAIAPFVVFLDSLCQIMMAIMHLDTDDQGIALMKSMELRKVGLDFELQRNLFKESLKGIWFKDVNDVRRMIDLLAQLCQSIEKVYEQLRCRLALQKNVFVFDENARMMRNLFS